MNTKGFSILLSCLLVGNFFIDIKAWQLSLYNQPNQSSSDATKKQNLDLYLTNVENILIVTNTTSNKSMVLDLDKNGLLLLDGSSGAAVIIFQEGNQEALIPNGVWDANQESIQDFLKSINNNITEILQRTECQPFTLSSCPQSILEEVSTIVQDLVAFIDPELQQRPVLALELILSISANIVKVANGGYIILATVINNQQIKLSVDICGVQNMLQALNELSIVLQIKVVDLVKLNPDLNIAPVFEATDGLVALIACFKELGVAGTNLTPLFKKLSDPEYFFKFIAQLGGNNSIGITEVFKVVEEIIKFTKGKSSLERVISLLIQYVAQSSQQIDKDLNLQLKMELFQMLQILVPLSCTDGVEDVIQIVRKLFDGTFVVDGVNISSIISKLLAGVCEPKEKLLLVVVEILLSLTPIVEPSKSIPELLLVLIIQLDSALGIQNLIALGINLDRPVLLKNLLTSVENLAQVLSSDLYEGCCKLPVISDVVLALEAILAVKDLNLKQILSQSEVQDLIKGVLQLVSDIDLGISESQLKQCKKAIETCNALEAYVEVEIFVTVIVTN